MGKREKIRTDAMDLCQCDVKRLKELLEEEPMNICIPIVSVDEAEWELADKWDGTKKRCDRCKLEDS